MGIFNNAEVARILYEIADALDIQGVDFKPVAYRNAARTLESLSRDINEVHKEGKLDELPGVGKSIAEKISELLETGHLTYLDELKKKIPIDFESLLSVPGIGPKKVKILFKKLGVKNIHDLENAAKKHLIKNLEGFGEKTENEILANIGFVKKSQERQLIGYVLPFANSIIEELRPHAKQILAAGSLRRMKETIGDVDILATSPKPEELTSSFTRLSHVEKVLSHGTTKASARMRNGLQVDIRVIEPARFGSALNYFTGSKEHNVKLRQIAISKNMKLSEYGLFDKKDKLLASKTEREVYAKLGMAYVEPEMRENRGEVELAQQRKLPKIIGYKDIKGDLQMHTNWSDGTHTIEEMARECLRLGYEYLGITDHAGSLKVANSLDEKRVDEQAKEIASVSKRVGIRILHGLEVNIKDDGNLDVPNNVLKKVQFVVAAIHSGFKNSREKMTNRICKAMENQYVTYIAHPTGRIINQRKAYELDIDKVFDKALLTGKYLEINSLADRLDLNDVNARAAVRKGLKLLINSDSHAKEGLANMYFGIATARRGWCEKKDILNTLALKQFEKVFLKG